MHTCYFPSSSLYSPLALPYTRCIVNFFAILCALLLASVVLRAKMAAFALNFKSETEPRNAVIIILKKKTKKVFILSSSVVYTSANLNLLS